MLLVFWSALIDTKLPMEHVWERCPTFSFWSWNVIVFCLQSWTHFQLDQWWALNVMSWPNANCIDGVAGVAACAANHAANGDVAVMRTLWFWLKVACHSGLSFRTCSFDVVHDKPAWTAPLTHLVLLRSFYNVSIENRCRKAGAKSAHYNMGVTHKQDGKPMQSYLSMADSTPLGIFLLDCQICVCRKWYQRVSHSLMGRLHDSWWFLLVMGFFLTPDPLSSFLRILSGSVDVCFTTRPVSWCFLLLTPSRSQN
jgi:hypothetical protein